MEDELPSEFDHIVIGSGLVESLLAAGLARAGKRVLHVDAAAHYGQDSAGMSWDALVEWSKAPRREGGTELKESEDGEIALDASERVRFHAEPDEAEKTGEDEDGDVVETVVEDMLHRVRKETALRSAKSRFKRFNVDLRPALCFGRGESTEAMVNLGVAHYLEFTGVKATYYVREGVKKKVPTSKQEVFASRDLGMAAKRRLMRFLQDAFDLSTVRADTVNERDLTSSRGLRRPQNKALRTPSQDEVPGQETEETTTADGTAELTANFFEIERRKKRTLTEGLREAYGFLPEEADLVAATVALAPSEDLSWDEGIQAVGRHLAALNAFVGCDSALVAPMYGSAELPQAFCRACAVRGGVYALRTPARALVLDDDRVAAVKFDRQTVACLDGCVVSADALGVSHSTRVYRRVALVLRPEGDKLADPAPVAFIVDRPKVLRVRAVLLDDSTLAVPEYLHQGLAILHLETESDADQPALDAIKQARDDLGLFTLGAVTFSWPVHDDACCSADSFHDNTPTNLAVCRRLRPTLDIHPDVRHAAQLARDKFNLDLLAPPQPEAGRDVPTIGQADDEDDLLADLVAQIEHPPEEKPSLVTSTPPTESPGPHPPPPANHDDTTTS